MENMLIWKLTAFQIRSDQEHDYTYDLKKDNVDKFQVVFFESICPIRGEASKP